MAKDFKKDTISYRINDEIYGFTTVRIVGDGPNGVFSLAEAKKLAQEMELDLVLMNPKAQPPIVQICNYEKLIYELKRKAKKQKQNTQQLKEVQLRVNISEHDLDIKVNQAKKFLEHGDKVKVVLTMRGRELSRRDESKRCILEFLVKLEDVCKIESLRDEGNRTIAILKSK